MEYTLFFLAVLPGLLLIRYVYKLDSIEKEPLGLLIKLVIYGAIATIPAIIIGLSANLTEKAEFSFKLGSVFF